MAKRLITKPTKRQRADAWRALHEVAANPESGDSARVSAARAIVADDPEMAEREAAAEESARWPKPLVSLPDNGASPPGTPLGISEDDFIFRIIYDGETPAGLADFARWQAEVSEKNRANSPKPQQLLLPAPRKPLTSTERSRFRRARLKAEKAKAAA
jgi:HrpA-like RNA helicase